MSWDDHCAALIPCRNEAATLPAVVRGVRQFISTVLVVDDGSSDDTAGAAQSSGAQCLRLLFSAGKGAALRAGFRELQRRGLSHVLTLDGDGQHSPSDIPRFLACADAGNADLVIGNRMAGRNGMPLLRWSVNRTMSLALSALTRQALPDSQCGFRLLRLASLVETEIRTSHFEFESELLVSLARRGGRIEFVTIQTIYGREASKIRIFPDTWRWLRWYGLAWVKRDGRGRTEQRIRKSRRPKTSKFLEEKRARVG